MSRLRMQQRRVRRQRWLILINPSATIRSLPPPFTLHRMLPRIRRTNAFLNPGRGRRWTAKSLWLDIGTLFIRWSGRGDTIPRRPAWEIDRRLKIQTFASTESTEGDRISPVFSHLLFLLKYAIWAAPAPVLGNPACVIQSTIAEYLTPAAGCARGYSTRV
jgi:hypothetical protein